MLCQQFHAYLICRRQYLGIDFSIAAFVVVPHHAGTTQSGNIQLYQVFTIDFTPINAEYILRNSDK